MAWDGSTRSTQLPKDRKQRRETVKQRAGGQCETIQHNGQRCPEPGTECDHKQRGNNHALTNLQWLCAWHHNRKTQHEAKLARQTAKGETSTVYHPGETHPALR